MGGGAEPGIDGGVLNILVAQPVLGKVYVFTGGEASPTTQNNTQATPLRICNSHSPYPQTKDPFLSHLGIAVKKPMVSSVRSNRAPGRLVSVDEAVIPVETPDAPST